MAATSRDGYAGYTIMALVEAAVGLMIPVLFPFTGANTFPCHH